MTFCVAVVEGHVVPNSITRSDIGGNDVTHYFTKLLTHRGYSFTTPQELVFDTPFPPHILPWCHRRRNHRPPTADGQAPTASRQSPTTNRQTRSEPRPQPHYNGTKELVNEMKEAVGCVVLDFEDPRLRENAMTTTLELPDGNVVELSSETFTCVEGMFQPCMMIGQETSGISDMAFQVSRTLHVLFEQKFEQQRAKPIFNQ